MREVVVCSAVRTAVGKGLRGSLKDTRPDDMLGAVLREAVARSGVDPERIDDVVVGCAMPEAEQGMNVARIGSFVAGLPDRVPGVTVNRFCSSGLQALTQGAAMILAGWQDVVLSGGVESMSLVPMGGEKPSPNPRLMAERPEAYTPMGITAENVAERWKVGREQQDAFAVESHRRAVEALEKGLFRDEIVPLSTRVYREGRWESITFDRDEGPRPGTSLEVLAKLKPAFKQGGTVTAGNTSQISDGAGASLVASREFAEKHNLPVIAVLRSFQVAGVAPDIMGIAPLYAIPKAVEAAGLSLSDIGLVELNEAFAAQAVPVIRELGLDPAIVNPHGGAIALGHPLGCTGARVTATLLHAMRRRGVRYGVVSMCIGGGMGAAAVFEAA